MIKISPSRLKFTIQRQHLIEFLISVTLVLECFSRNDKIKFIYYLSCIVIQLCLLVQSFFKNSSKEIIVYIRTVFIIGAIAILFICIDVAPILVMGRIVPIISIYGMVIVGNKSLDVDIEAVVHNFAVFYVWIGTVINIDAANHMLAGKAIWPPIYYLGARYVGPMGDSNFLAFWSAAVLIILIYSDFFNNKFRKFGILMLTINILLARSLSTFALLPTAIIINHFWKEKRLRRKQTLILAGDFAFLAVYSAFHNQIQMIGIHILEKIMGSTYAATVKYVSLSNRFDVQCHALRIFMDEWWGQGPRQLVAQLGLDTHNSYIGIMFELGILGLFLIVSTLKNDRPQSKMVDCYSLFVMLSGLLLNIHYSAIYLLLLIMQYLNAQTASGQIIIRGDS